MMTDDVQGLCALGQELLTEQRYIEAENRLLQAEHEAWRIRDWDALARLYMPLQEARRQRRQRCTEGEISLSLFAQGPADQVVGRHVLENYPEGQLLVAGWASVEPALQVRRLQMRFGLYVDVFLGAVYPLISGLRVIVIVPHERVLLPEPNPRRLDELTRLLQPGCIIVPEDDLPANGQKGDAVLQARLQSWWETLHRPFLNEARERAELVHRIEAYRRVLRVDYGCELAHQELAATAHELARLTPVAAVG